MYLIIVFGWIIYFAVHSFLAANVVKQWFKLHLPVISKYYRMLYNIIAIIGLLILIQITFSDSKLLFTTNRMSNGIAVVLFLTGSGILAISFYTFDKMEFLGLRKPEKNDQSKLVVSGIYQYMRHPLYSGTFFLVAGVLLWHPTVAIALFFAITILYIEIGSRLEERKLTEEFGQAYSTYAETVKRYFPYLY
jgi:protein-S-isoprenylcysteine O-methyltransferase Ste14